MSDAAARAFRPAWSEAFDPASLPTIRGVPALDEVSPAWAWGGSTGAGVKVAIIDSGVDAAHPAVGDVQGYVAISEDADGALVYDETPHDDLFGHGTACAGIVRALAPSCEIYSIRVLGADLTGRGKIFAAGLRWAIDQGLHVCNLSLSTGRAEFFALFHELADLAYFRHIPLVCAANNAPGASYPSLYATVLSVAAHEGTDPSPWQGEGGGRGKAPVVIYYNPAPPVEFGAPGIDLQVAWLGGATITATGNSFAAPHITGLVARLLGKHPGLTVFQIKTVLRALAANVV